MGHERSLPPSGPRIQIEGVRHVYGRGVVALDGVSLAVEAGLFGLLGPNGAGKSTLMRIVCTILVPSEGSVRVAGHDVVRECHAVRSLLGYLPQEFSAWRSQRVEEVLDLCAALSGLRDRKARRQRIDWVLGRTGLAAVADRKVKALSGGMVRRLGVAQALVHDPPLLVVDEPTVGLDPQERLRFRQLMTGLAQERTILLSTHIVADLGAGCAELAVLDRGKIVFRGTPADLAAQAQGRVFEMTLPAHEDREDLGEGIEVISRVREGAAVRVRALATSALPPGARPIEEPTLEEGYLAFMAARGRAEAALAEEAAS